MNYQKYIPPIITDLLISKSIPNLLGDRLVEWSWSASRIPESNFPDNHALDLGTGSSYISLIAAFKGWRVTCIDLSHLSKPYHHDNISYRNGDILTMPLDLDNKYSLVINVSFIEHVGKPGQDKGDYIAMNRIYQAMTNNSIMLLTVPCGENPGNNLARCYNSDTLNLLASRFEVLEQSYFAKINGNTWTRVDRDTACNYPNKMSGSNPLKIIYALGMLVLHKPGEIVNATGTINSES